MYAPDQDVPYLPGLMRMEDAGHRFDLVALVAEFFDSGRIPGYALCEEGRGAYPVLSPESQLVENSGFLRWYRFH